MLKDEDKETNKIVQILMTIIFDFGFKVEIDGFTYKTMSDEGLEAVKSLDPLFSNIKERYNILYPLLREREKIEALEFQYYNRNWLAKWTLGAIYVYHNRFQ